MLEGEATFYAPTGEVIAHPGTLVHVPRGMVHTIKNTGTTILRALVMVTPAGFERFFFAAGTSAGDPEQWSPVTEADIDRLMEAAPRHNLELVLPAE